MTKINLLAAARHQAARDTLMLAGEYARWRFDRGLSPSLSFRLLVGKFHLETEAAESFPSLWPLAPEQQQ